MTTIKYSYGRRHFKLFTNCLGTPCSFDTNYILYNLCPAHHLTFHSALKTEILRIFLGYYRVNYDDNNWFKIAAAVMDVRFL